MSDAAAARDADADMRDAAAAAVAPPGDDEGDTEDDEEDDDVDEEDPPAPAPAQETPAPEPVSALPADPNQLTLLFQGEVYVFDSVTPDKVQAVLLLLGSRELPPGLAGMVLPNQNESKGYDDILRRTDIPAKRVASLIRFREKRKERNFDKKIRYAVRKEVALRTLWVCASPHVARHHKKIESSLLPLPITIQVLQPQEMLALFSSRPLGL